MRAVALAAAAAAAASGVTIQNDAVTAVVDPAVGLVSLAEKGGGAALSFSADSWSVTVDGATVTPAACSPPTSDAQAAAVTARYSCGKHSVNVTYSVARGGGFVEKGLSVSSASGDLEFTGAGLFVGTGVALDGATGAATSVIRGNPYDSEKEIGGFLRWAGHTRGAFFSVVNPFGKHDAATAGCSAGRNHPNDDLPGMPLVGLTADQCREQCANRTDCAGYVELADGCEGGPQRCFLKSAAAVTEKGESCSCLQAKPFSSDPTATITAAYSGTCKLDAGLQGGVFTAEHAVIGFTTLTAYESEGLTQGEQAAMKRCVEAHLLDTESRRNRTVKINVAWDENDYQIDVGTEEGKTEYKRIIDKNAEFGVTHIVYEPRNTLHSSRYNTTDGWGWEGSLWFSMGELLREGRWDPRTDAVPEDILDMVKYASGKGVKLNAYAYPCLPFADLKKYWSGSGPNSVSLAAPQVQSYFIEVMSAFLDKTGAGGFAWDHGILSGSSSLVYSQWRGWMHILAELRRRHPDIVMDHRQSAHRWGPWYQLAGSYDEPIAGDENPETYGVPIASLHTDHVAADNTRRVNYVFSTQQLIPAVRVPGFIFHQSERTDDDGRFYCTKNEKQCYNNSNTRDFDFLGYKYSLLSTVGTAGMNNVVTMIPARDPAENSLLPAADRSFIRDWLSWTDANIEYLRRTAWIPSLGAPRLGAVDGTHSMVGDEGYLFLFNPNMQVMSAKFTVDDCIGLFTASSADTWTVTELYPVKGGAVATWAHGEAVNVSVGGSDVRVLQLRKAGQRAGPRLLHATQLRGSVRATAGGAEIYGAVGPAGGAVNVTVRSAAGSLSVNGVRCSSARASGEDVVAEVRFGGDAVHRVGPISPDLPPKTFTGGWFNTTTTVSAAVVQQLDARAKAYPIPWTNSSTGCGLPHCVDDSKATWLVPTRLLLTPFIANVADSMKVRLWLDGAEVPLQHSYNSRGRKISKCFLGFYHDASAWLARPGVPHSVAVLLPTLPEGAFTGVFWENLETEYESAVASC